MPLKRLELSNFKSYRGQQVIDFGDAPFMCIIGPNGAGKSNLMDAISFVLGVKSAQLRSTQLKDLVYRGRKAAQAEDETMSIEDDGDSQAHSNDARTAYVMAVYEDDKNKEWRFRRSITTTGASTYYLNGKAVPWNLYNQQLEKFNILVKAKNFLVFQGDVEGVASQDSKALAKLIDRISGWALSRLGSLDLAPAYEASKAAQEKATDASTANYAKKRTMLTEVRHFKEQREEIKQWEKLRDEKDALVQRHLLWRLYHLTEEINESTKQVEEANEKLTDLRAAVNDNDSKFRLAKKDQNQALLNVKKREAGVKRAEKAYDDKRQSDSLETLQRGAADVKKSMAEAVERQRKASQAKGKTLSAADLAEYRTLRSAANLRAVSERQQLESLHREQKNLRDALASAEDKIQQAERRKTKLTEEVNSLSSREVSMSDKLAELNDERERLKAQLEHAQAERERVNMKVTEINEKLQETYNKLLQAGVDKRESEREAKLKEVLQSLKRVFPGVHGRVVDLCKPTARKYDTAVMTVLGRHIDAVVVEQEKVAIDCIEYMRNQRAGQATFIPLDTIQVKPVAERLRNFARGARLAFDCIEYEPAVERAMQHVCGNAMICDSMDIAKQICYDKGQEVKAVTLEGTVIHRSGLITGGQGSGGSRKFDDREVQGLQRLKEQYLQQLQDLNRAKPKDNADEGVLENLARLDAEATIAKDDLVRVFFKRQKFQADAQDATRLRLNGLRAELNHVESDFKKLSPDLEKRSRAVRTLEQKTADLAKTVNTADDETFDAFCKKIKISHIQEYEDVQLKLATEESEALEAFTTQQARINHQIEFETSQLSATRERLASLRATIDRENHNVDKLRSSKRALEKELDQLQAEIEHQRGKLSNAQAAYDKATDLVEEMRDATRKTQRMLDKVLKEIGGWNDEIEKASSDRHAIYRRCRLEEIDLPLIRGSLDKVPIEENLQKDGESMDVDDDGTQRPARSNDYGIEPDFDVLEDEDRENDAEELGHNFEAQIAALKANLDKMIPNMKAIDRLADVQTGLDEAEREAEETRQESKRAREEYQQLRKKRCDLFNKAYNHMTGCIDKIYKDLTKSKTFPTGGVGFLSLEDAEEPYLSGVKYNVMPPGKRFAEMDQLSGGEKTMAALALLFAIHSFHPAPFFVLDEVDAALDPTNVSKLARYVREQAEKEVQFLIISLKTTLYEHADGLVGVYREQEENSSKTLTLDLRNYVE
ncbi:hypothetical protein TREMEDRAFT_62305 [Tremella mesenterica DSM 1558]|uniref:uncharacterized protein n=1 Tax=Tremella mesenterica (strain ATCC 24925 / CBS 8224 / DSM 1558 / NBRC 9311 / NRRL Y-6157 / RJB 2259-6 / UBC 559-6) TaxID=578456 RepID=UPI0003F48CD0|nr:uncharacterized protein TREMEDRAFT_62305 [Tremella mesenterica DSM 1558]EIW69438.1 hypothetical protein TREMEDRAFT_62305 [Tremella mesenterica DSM 1558]